MTKTTLFHYRTAIKITAGIAVTFPLASLAESQTTSNQAVIETMVVTAAGYEQSTLEAPASISVIDRTQIENRS
ncbi:MAG: TonB-dependent receptor domain-containing protein, partial [Vibrionaceae bacterium]